MGADRVQRRGGGVALGLLVGLLLLVPGSAFASPRDANGTSRVGGLTFSVTEFDPDESFSWTVRGVFVSGDECRVQAEGGLNSGWVACGSLTGTHSFSSEGEKWFTLEVRNGLPASTVLTRLLVVDVLTDAPAPVKFNSPQDVSPITFATPQPVTVPTPVPVRWKGCDPVTNECPAGGGFGSWTDDDAENLAHIAGQSQRQSRNTVAIGAFSLFALAGLLVLGLGKVR